jgi:hypothetical protein
MSFDRDKLFDVNATDEELHYQLKEYFLSGGTGTWLVAMIINTPMNGITSHTGRLMTILENLSEELMEIKENEIDKTNRY